MKPRGKYELRLLLALTLFLALAVVRGLQSDEEGEAHGTVIEMRQELPGSCAIIATEAYHRVAKTAVWARLLHIEVNDGKNVIGHMVAVWQPDDNAVVLVYDTYLWTGTREVDTRLHDANVIVAALARAFPSVQLAGAHFI